MRIFTPFRSHTSPVIIIVSHWLQCMLVIASLLSYSYVQCNCFMQFLQLTKHHDADLVCDRAEWCKSIHIAYPNWDWGLVVFAAASVCTAINLKFQPRLCSPKISFIFYRQMKIWGTSAGKQQELSKMLDEWYCEMYPVIPDLQLILFIHGIHDWWIESFPRCSGLYTYEENMEISSCHLQYTWPRLSLSLNNTLVEVQRTRIW